MRRTATLATAASALTSNSPLVLHRFTDKTKLNLITLNKEKSLNSLNEEMVEALLPMYQAINDGAHAGSNGVVIKGAGPKAFCAGGDVVSIVKDDPAGAQKRFFYREYQMNYAIKTLKVPHVALWNGIVMGGGVGVSVHGSHRVVSEKAVFAMPETSIGLFPDVGGSWFLPRLEKKGLGLYLGLTGQRLKGADLWHAGIATHFVPAEAMGTLERVLGGDAGMTMLSATDGTETLDDKKRTLSNVISAVHLDTKIVIPNFSLQDNLEAIEKHFSGKPTESIEAILDSLKSDDSEWAKKTAETIEKCCPASLKVSLEIFHRGAAIQDPADIFRMEYRATQKIMAEANFKGGVTALLIDKTGKFEWQPNTLKGMTDEMVKSYFEPAAHGVEWDPVAPFPTTA